MADQLYQDMHKGEQHSTVGADELHPIIRTVQIDVFGGDSKNPAGPDRDQVENDEENTGAQD